MKRIASVSSALVVFAALVSACNDSALTNAPDPEESPTPDEVTPTPEVSPTPPLPAEADVAVTVHWDDLGMDWELHLVKPGGQINDNLTDCTWTSCISTSPDWGVQGDSFDDPHKDIDDTNTFGPERIWLAEPEAGVFTVLVEHWGSGAASSDGYVSILVGSQVYEVPMNDLPPQYVWTAATIEFPSGVVTTAQSVYDCTASWALGCTAPLP